MTAKLSINRLPVDLSLSLDDLEPLTSDGLDLGGRDARPLVGVVLEGEYLSCGAHRGQLNPTPLLSITE